MLKQSRPNFSKVVPKVPKAVFTLHLKKFKIAQKVTKNLGYFGEKICHKELLKIARSGHAEFAMLH